MVALERAVEELRERAAPASDAAAGSGTSSPAGADRSATEEDPFWALDGLEHRMPGSVLMTGSLDVPEAGPVRWQVAQHGEALLEQDWTELAGTLDALAHPARLTILRLVMNGIRTTAELLQQDSLGTTGQLHHHLRQLVAGGWLTSPRRGHYEVPATRVVPLLITVLAATR